MDPMLESPPSSGQRRKQLFVCVAAVTAAAAALLVVRSSSSSSSSSSHSTTDVPPPALSLRSKSSSSKSSSTASDVAAQLMGVTHVNRAVMKPNIVFILADDLSYQDLGGLNKYEGAQDLKDVTPTLTAMAKDSLVLGNYYAMETCTPTRAALLTGRYPLKMGMQYGVVEMSRGWGLPLAEQTLAEVLRDEGYKTHMIGKWHLGHHSPMLLPTARGFETFTGFLDSENYYFSKRSPSNDKFVDFLVADEDCYYTYTGPSLHNYSTHLYREVAVKIIEEHDASDPLFLYLAFNAVHVPFNDIPDEYPNGYREAPDEWLSAGVKAKLDAQVTGTHRRLYAATLNMLDSAVGKVKDALEEKGMLDNTYIIFASDNGGCYLGGGKNAPLRGNKATLLEGGTKVDAFIYSPLMKDVSGGTVYKNLFHVTDWFPTIVELAGIDFQERDGHELDGVSQVSGFQGDKKVPRQYMLYNSYTNVADEDLDMWTNGAFAIRNLQYKLVHYFDNDDYAGYQTPFDVIEDDMLWTSKAKECKSLTASVGAFTYGLYDLINDPYETTNLYDVNTDDLVAVKTELYDLMVEYNKAAAEDVVNQMDENKEAMETWADEGGGYVIPWTDLSSKKTLKKLKQEAFSDSYPSFCGPTAEFSVYEKR
jgi:arylsulfatase A-like enzyme